jgi:predicted acylesterase/phospholipase RssA
MDRNYETLVLSGGGSKGLVHLGTLEFVWQMGYLENIHNYWGVSIGSIISLFLVLGYTPYEVFRLFFQKGILRLGDASDGFIGLMSIEAIGKRIIELLDFKITRKTTFKELYKLKNKPFNVIGCCKNCEIDDKLQIFNHIKTPDMPVIDAIEISCALPFIFTEKIYNGYRYIDGCFVNDLPIDLAYKNGDKSILAVWVKSDSKMAYTLLNDIYELLTIPMNQMQLLRNKDIPAEVIEINSPGAGFSDLNPERSRQVEMWGEGYRAAENYYIEKDKEIEGWKLDFDFDITHEDVD